MIGKAGQVEVTERSGVVLKVFKKLNKERDTLIWKRLIWKKLNRF